MLPRVRLLNFGRHLARQRKVNASASGGSAARLSLSKSPRLILVGASTMAMLVWTLPAAGCAAEEAGEGAPSAAADGSAKPDEMERFIHLTVVPMCNKLGFGGVMGFCSGVAARSVGEHVIYWAGIAFTAVQVAQYNGYIDIDWYKVKDQGTCCSPLTQPSLF